MPSLQSSPPFYGLPFLVLDGLLALLLMGHRMCASSWIDPRYWLNTPLIPCDMPASMDSLLIPICIFTYWIMPAIVWIHVLGLMWNWMCPSGEEEVAL